MNYFIEKNRKKEKVSYSEYQYYLKNAGLYIGENNVLNSFYDPMNEIIGWGKEEEFI
jgi:hypothetical protein